MTCHVTRWMREAERRRLLDRWQGGAASSCVLAEIEAAEERLSMGTFGVCEACAQPIPLERLRALPTARLCATCEETVELAVGR